jgi:hypothetical protein
MARYRTVVDIPMSRDELFAYMADFSNVAEWDPSIVEAARLDSGDIDVGSKFRVVVSNMGRQSPLIYELIEYDAAGSATFCAETRTIKSVDSITVSQRPAGVSRLTWEADLRLKGFLRLGDLAMRLIFKRIGDKGRDGLVARLGGQVVTG